MSKSAKSPRVILAILKLPEEDVPGFLVRAQAICNAMDGNPWFPDPDPPLAVIRDSIAVLRTAETTMLSQRSVRADRNEKRNELNRLLKQECSYVQRVADANPELSVSIIEGAGMFVK